MTTKNRPLIERLTGSGANSLNIARWLSKIRIKPEAVVACLASFLVSVAALLVSSRQNDNGLPLTSEFEAGKVAERDFIADYPVSYVDGAATRRALEDAVSKLPAVFIFDENETARVVRDWNAFAQISRRYFEVSPDAETFRTSVEEELGVTFQGSTLEALYHTEERDLVLKETDTILEEALKLGIFKTDADAALRYNSREGDLLHIVGTRTERERVQLDRVLTLDKMDAYIRREAAGSAINRTLNLLAVPLLEPFLRENVFFSSEDTALSLAQIRAEPVMRRIERGERVIRKGFIVSSEDIEKLSAFSGETRGDEALPFLGRLLTRILLAVFIVLWGGRRIAGRPLRLSEIYLLSGLCAFYFICVAVFQNLAPNLGMLPVSVLFPTAICVLVPSFLIRHRLALVLAVALPLGAFLSGAIDGSAFVFALASGIAASLVLHNAQKRIDLVKAGFQIALTQLAAMLALLLSNHAPLAAYPPGLFWGAFNGVASGMFVLGILPLLENLMNAATSFRLVELSDVNAPTLKRLFTVAPGTYSHSMMVANLAEAAVQEIGGNALLARVGAYYHDIGKMEQPDYFVENQGGYNKHDEISPRLSATILRSHVKIGVEKATALGLPREVIDIIAEHHGNSLIRWFYDAAVKREGAVNREDFCYPGNPPRTRESAVVMLADVTEAAARTLEKPSVSRLEKFITELIEGKFAGGQLSESDMTFRDLEQVKQTFVRVLAGYYHSRIEYPRGPETPAGTVFPTANGTAAVSAQGAVPPPNGDRHE